MVPAIYADCGGEQPIVAAGASIGAFNSLALICRFPQLFHATVGMSGTYSVDKFLGGEFTDDLYFASPLHFLPGMDGPTLDLLRTRRVILASGSGAWEDLGQSWKAAEALDAKGTPKRVEDGPRLRARPADLVGDAAAVPR